MNPNDNGGRRQSVGDQYIVCRQLASTRVRRNRSAGSAEWNRELFLMDRTVLTRMDSRRLTGYRHGCLADHPSGIRATIGMELYAGLSTFSGAGRYLFLHGEPVGAAAGYAGAACRRVARGGASDAAGAAFHIHAWVVLPDHLHCVWTLRREMTISPIARGRSRYASCRRCRTPSGAPRFGLRRAAGSMAAALLGARYS